MESALHQTQAVEVALRKEAEEAEALLVVASSSCGRQLFVSPVQEQSLVQCRSV